MDRFTMGSGTFVHMTCLARTMRLTDSENAGFRFDKPMLPNRAFQHASRVPPGDVVLGQPLARIRQQRIGLAELDEPALMQERRVIRRRARPAACCASPAAPCSAARARAAAPRSGASRPDRAPTPARPSAGSRARPRARARSRAAAAGRARARARCRRGARTTSSQSVAAFSAVSTDASSSRRCLTPSRRGPYATFS